MTLWLKIGKLCHFIKELIRDIQKGLVFVTSSVIEIGDELILAHNKNRPLNLRKVMDHTVDSVTLMCRAQKQTSEERKAHLKPALNGVT